MANDKGRLEIGHVLFIDIVGYSKLLLKEQSELQRELNGIVSGTSEVEWFRRKLRADRRQKKVGVESKLPGRLSILTGPCRVIICCVLYRLDAKQSFAVRPDRVTGFTDEPLPTQQERLS